MSLPASTNITEPDDIDVLTMKTQEGDWVYIAICPDDKSKISFVSFEGKQLIINKKEAGLIIDGLWDCIRNLSEINDIKKEENEAKNSKKVSKNTQKIST